MESNDKQIPQQQVSDLVEAAQAAHDVTHPKQLTEQDFRNLRRLYFTVRHDIVKTCGHKLDKINQPKNNCEYCWFAFFQNHGELVQVTDRAYAEQGIDFLDKMRGKKYRVMFCRFMITMARLKKENDEQQKPEVSSDQISGIGTEQAVQDGNNVPDVQQESAQASAVHTNESSLS